MKSLFTFFTLTAVIGLLNAAAPTDAPSVPGPAPHHPRHPHPRRQNFQPGPPQKPGSNANFWRFFSRLSPAEQKEIMLLQRTDPEKFRATVQEKVEKFQAEQREQHRKINELAEKIRNSKDEKEKAVLRTQLRTMLKTSFDSRLAQMRRNIDANKKRIARMEAELQKRESNAEAIVDAITDSVISGKRQKRSTPGPRTR